MAYIELPKLYHPDFAVPGRKPVDQVEVDWSNPITRGLIGCFLFNGVDLVDGSKTTKIGSAPVHPANGDLCQSTNGSTYFSVADSGKFNVTSVTVTSVLNNAWSNGASRPIAGKGDTQYMLRGQSSGGSFLFFTYDGSWHNAQVTGLTGENWIISGVCDGSTVSLYVDGEQKASASGGISTSAYDFELFRNSQQTSRVCNNFDVPLVCVHDRALSDAEIALLHRDPYQLLKPTIPMMYFTSAGGTTLIVQSLAQSQSIGAPSLTQDHNLSVNDLDQSQSIGQPSLTQQYTLTTNGLNQAQTIDNVELTQAHILTTNGLVQSQLVGSPSLTQHNVLTVAGLSQAQLTENISLTVGGSLAVNAINQAQTIGQPGLTQHHQLSIDDILQTQSTGNVTLSVLGELQVNDIEQAQLIDAATLTQHHALTVQSLLQSQSIDAISIFNQSISVDGVSQSQSIDQSSLTQAHILAVDSLTQSQLIDIVSFGGAVIGYLRGEIVIAAMHNGNVTITKLLDGNVTLN